MSSRMDVDEKNDSIDNENDNVVPSTKDGLIAAKSIQGYVLIVTNVHEEAAEEDVTDFFSDFGRVRGVHLNLDRQSGYVKGYALVEFREKSEAEEAVREADGSELLGTIINVDFAFVESPEQTNETKPKQRERSPDRGGRYESRQERDQW
ncbi:CYFA0S08e00980g1_1 [Cyberlindnera fabianii]|uniref:CYFA0S08e00980g1_1 n=1 Tax=Cyberlindnera fabianii TaxID=36022 RepID=A0A061AW37_CYBFA|nr:CYFA0S08e00980g1_1 [Cyberlindnera fabianii]